MLTTESAMRRAMGTYDTNNVTVNHDYPVAFQEAFAEVLREERPAGPRFRFVLLSGKFVRQDQEQHLYFLEEARKIKVCVPSFFSFSSSFFWGASSRNL